MSPSRRTPRNAKNKRGKGADSCPVELGKEYKVDITEMSPDGEGIGRIKNFLVFVDGAKVGDHLKVKITTIGTMNAGATIVI
jgi:predicted RNA-binding protein with TRAM domain